MVSAFANLQYSFSVQIPSSQLYKECEGENFRGWAVLCMHCLLFLYGIHQAISDFLICCTMQNVETRKENGRQMIEFEVCFACYGYKKKAIAKQKHVWLAKIRDMWCVISVFWNGEPPLKVIILCCSFLVDDGTGVVNCTCWKNSLAEQKPLSGNIQIHSLITFGFSFQEIY